MLVSCIGQSSSRQNLKVVLAALGRNSVLVGQENALKETLGARSRTSSISRLSSPPLPPVVEFARISLECCTSVFIPVHIPFLSPTGFQAFRCRQRSKPTVASRPNVASRLYTCPFSTHGLAPSSRTLLHRQHSFIHNDHLIILRPYCDKPSTVLGRLVRSLPKP